MSERESSVAPKYERILFEELAIPPSFLSKQNKDDIIRTRLLKAYELMRSGVHPIAIAACVHVASSVVLLESSPERVDATLGRIQSDAAFAGQDPTTVITSAALYHLVHKNIDDRSVPDEQRRGLVELSRRLDELNWMIGPSAMKALDMDARARGAVAHGGE